MAMGTIGGEESREKQQKWTESNNKVYTRKNHSKRKNPASDPQQSSQQTIATTTTDENNSQVQRAINASDDLSSHNRAQPSLQNDYNGGASGYVKFDNLVKINLNCMVKSEGRAIKRKLVSELDLVRSLVKKLEAKEVQFTSGYAHSQYSGNEIVGKAGTLARVSSDVGSAGIPDSRPFRGLSVSVVDNDHIHSSHGVNVVGGSGEILEKEKRTPKANQYYKNSDFVMGKGKSTPVESNKKFKQSEGKSNGSERGSGIGEDKFLSQLFKKCSNLLGKLMKNKFGWVFNTPVDVKALGLHDYYTIIKKPMDLGTVKTRLNKNWYKSPREFAEDVRLTFTNAMLYNPKGQDVHFMAEALSKMFEESWAAIETECNLNRRLEISHDLGLPTHNLERAPVTSSSAPAPTTPAPPPPVPTETRLLERSESSKMAVDTKSRSTNLAPPGRTPVPKKPKAKDPDKRDMTYEEKQRLSLNLQNLPSEKLDSVVQIIRKKNPALFQQEDEIEVDIDSVDPETLWELDRFVTNYKKSLSKNKRKSELALQANGKAYHNNEKIINLDPSPAEATKVSENVERSVPPSSPAQRSERQGENASGSSSSSSSSSDSGSSSSGSDSDSSSG